MKKYLQTIQILKTILLDISIIFLIIFPVILAFFPEKIPYSVSSRLYDLSHITVFFVIIIRPLADIFDKNSLIRPLVTLRKGFGVLSASIIVSFILSKLIVDPAGYFANIFTSSYWSLENFALLAHLGDISAVILLITSNKLSKTLLGGWWKKIQKLAYLYFYAGSLYVFLAYEKESLAYSISIATVLIVVAWFKNRSKRKLQIA